MNIFEQFLNKISHKFPKGYPDMNNEQDISLLENLVSKVLGEDIKLDEAKKPYENLSNKAKETAEDIMKTLNLTKDNIKSSSKDRIIILSDIPRPEVFKALEKLGYKKDTNIPGSSAGGYISPNGTQIITKSESLTKVGGAGIENENIFVDNINKYIDISDNNEITVIITGGSKTITYKKVTNAKNIGKEGESKGWKGDALLFTTSGTKSISIKKDGPFRWESAMGRYRDLYDTFMEKAYNKKIPNLELIPDPENPKVLQMMNPKTKTPYGRIFITEVPGLNDQLEDLVFGKDKAIVIQKTFTDNDFTFDGDKDILTVNVTKIITSVDEIEKGDLPVLEFERNASKATQTSGYKGRGIILRISPQERMTSASSRANNLILTYNQAVS
jgi:hypothetical protein